MEDTGPWTCGHECWDNSLIADLFSIDEFWYCEICLEYLTRREGQ